MPSPRPCSGVCRDSSEMLTRRRGLENTETRRRGGLVCVGVGDFCENTLASVRGCFAGLSGSGDCLRFRDEFSFIAGVGLGLCSTDGDVGDMRSELCDPLWDRWPGGFCSECRFRLCELEMPVIVRIPDPVADAETCSLLPLMSSALARRNR